MADPIYVTVDDTRYSLRDAVDFDAQAERYDRNVKDQTLYAQKTRELAQRIRDAVKAATPITLVTDPNNLDHTPGILSDGAAVSVQTRVGGIYGGKGFFITPPPKGYEWVVVKDEFAANVLILRQRVAPFATLGASGGIGPVEEKRRESAKDEARDYFAGRDVRHTYGS